MYYTVKDDAGQEIFGSVHVSAAVPDDAGDDSDPGDADLPSDWDSGGTSATPVDTWSSLSILVVAQTSGQWVYTQACAKCSGGCITCNYGTDSEPAINIPNHYGDCTDFVWAAVSNTLNVQANRWPHRKLNTKLFNTLSSIELAAHGYAEVDSASVRPGDVVVRTIIGDGGHAGIFMGWVAGAGPAGWANNGQPATDTRPNQPLPTGKRMFKSNTGQVTKFFRPQTS